MVVIIVLGIVLKRVVKIVKIALDWYSIYVVYSSMNKGIKI
jgi:hypothetical protein|tara:strand:+ start:579 stop:701 length:123 start_codon:yes stop_codon:yes gene_type:complete